MANKSHKITAIIIGLCSGAALSATLPITAIAAVGAAVEAAPSLPPLPAATPAAPACTPIADLDAAIALNPRDAPLRLKRGMSYANRGAFDCAIADFTETLALSQGDAAGDAQALTLRGAAYAAKGEPDLAIADYSKAIELAPGQQAPFYKRGLLRADKSEFGPAAEDFTQAIAFEPSNTQLYLSRGVAYAGLGDTARAITDFNHVLEMEPNSSAAHDNLGKIHLLMGEPDLAIDEFSRAIELDSTAASPYFGRGSAYRIKGNIAPAITDYTTAQSLDPADAAILTALGSAYRAHGDYALAITTLTKAITLAAKDAPKDADAYYQLGLTHYFVKKYNDALKSFARSAALTTNANEKFYPAFWTYAAKAKLGFKGQTIFYRAIALMNKNLWPAPIAGLFEGTVSPAELVAQISNANPRKAAEKQCQAYFYLGEWYLMNGNPQAAITAFKAANARNQYHLPEYEAARVELQGLGEKLD